MPIFRETLGAPRLPQLANVELPLPSTPCHSEERSDEESLSPAQPLRFEAGPLNSLPISERARKYSRPHHNNILDAPSKLFVEVSSGYGNWHLAPGTRHLPP